jgi:hypothetical protein
VPNLGAAIFFAIIFGFITAGIVMQSIYYRSGYMWVLAMGTTCNIHLYDQSNAGSVIGFCFRAKGHFDPTIFGDFLVAQIFIVHPLPSFLKSGSGSNILSGSKLHSLRAPLTKHSHARPSGRWQKALVFESSENQFHLYRQRRRFLLNSGFWV